MNLDNAISGTIVKKGQRDSYTFEGKLGQQLFYDTLNSTNSFQVTVYDPTGKLIDTFDSRSDRGVNNASLFLKMDGKYKVTVDGIGEATGDYKFRLLDRALANQIELDTDITGKFIDNNGSPLQALSYKFDLSERKYIYFDGQAGANPNRYYVYDQVGQLVIDSAINQDNELYLDTGSYWLVLAGNNNATNADINYKVRVVDAIQSLTPLLNLDNAISGTIVKKGQRDSYTFEGKLGQQLFY
ncbi:hypothetical protein WDZ92_49070, partial [Nostoc sp. NIES-2111]